MRHMPQSQLTRDEGAGTFIFYLFMAVLGLHCCTGFFLVSVSRGCSLPGVHRLHYMQHVGSAVVAPGLSLSAPVRSLSDCGAWS